VGFLAMGFWGWTADRIGRRWSMIIPAALTIPVAPLYLLTNDFNWIFLGFVLQAAFGGAIYGQQPSYLCERFPTEVRGTASGFCYHQGAIFGGLVAPVVSYFAVEHGMGFGIPLLIATTVAAASFVVALLLSPETKGKELVPDLVIA
jgi:SHS family lactate transporter-like MFS transporter